MSLHTLAHHLQNAGRGEDKVLVHMTPKEVNGLQQLAMAHGGSLTINPETGLAEAGFLSSLLPTVIGAGLTIASGGALSPLMAAGITGAGYGLAKGSLREGLMAGLGAYGGAGLASGLTTAGADVLAAAPSGVPAGTPLPTNTVTPLADVAGSGQLAGGNINAMANTYGQAANAATLSPFNYTQGMNMDPASYASGLTPANTMAQPTTWDKFQAGFKDVTSSGDKAWDFVKKNPGTFAGIGLTALQGMREQNKPSAQDQGLIRPYKFAYNPTGADVQPYSGSGERMYFNPQYTALTPYKAPGPEYAAEGGLMGLHTYAVGGPVEEMSAANAIGANTMYPQSQFQTSMYSNPMVQRPMPANVVSPSGDAGVDPYSGEARFADGGVASGLGSYSDGGRLLKGPGDGVSDSIPAVIGNRQPARVADGEFVVPARIVSELGNGSTEAGARRLYAMMDRIQKARGKTIGKDNVAVNSRADKYLPA